MEVYTLSYSNKNTNGREVLVDIYDSYSKAEEEVRLFISAYSSYNFIKTDNERHYKTDTTEFIIKKVLVK